MLRLPDPSGVVVRRGNDQPPARVERRIVDRPSVLKRRKIACRSAVQIFAVPSARRGHDLSAARVEPGTRKRAVMLENGND